ncbi:hypothetical protein CWI38_0086p0030 [Hamiltosporidium tvaerminnensis]|uniref:Uncharacterized protein n=1 Tax=Hamiltosporidium tvaerminnensis TaxID=1176355 RepID=A0A4Q9M482_9MICR|nr:hypothetical protein CWI38_0086p0030 [Hamiltosporidium tvaerminnensis]
MFLDNLCGLLTRNKNKSKNEISINKSQHKKIQNVDNKSKISKTEINKKPIIDIYGFKFNTNTKAFEVDKNENIDSKDKVSTGKKFKPKISQENRKDRGDDMCIIKGVQRTNSNFLSRVVGNEVQKEIIIRKLRSLGIFSNVEMQDGRIKVQELKRRINFGGKIVNENVNGTLKIELPNLLGKGENINFEIDSDKMFTLKGKKPIIFMSKVGKRDNFKKGANTLKIEAKKNEEENNENNKIWFTELSIYRKKNWIPGINFIFDGVSIGIQTEKTELILTGEKLNNKFGTLKDLSKGVIKFLKKYNLGKYNLKTNSEIGCFYFEEQIQNFFKNEIFATSKWKFRKYFLKFYSGIGNILGDIHESDKFWLGKNIKGYKDMAISPLENNMKIGGLSYVETGFKMGREIYGVDVFGFFNAGFCSKQRNIMETIKNMTRTYIYLPESTSMGLSWGVGMSTQLNSYKSIEMPRIEATLAFPLVKNSDIERLQIGVDLEF